MYQRVCLVASDVMFRAFQFGMRQGLNSSRRLINFPSLISQWDRKDPGAARSIYLLRSWETNWRIADRREKWMCVLLQTWALYRVWSGRVHSSAAAGVALCHQTGENGISLKFRPCRLKGGRKTLQERLLNMVTLKHTQTPHRQTHTHTHTHTHWDSI